MNFLLSIFCLLTPLIISGCSAFKHETDFSLECNCKDSTMKCTRSKDKEKYELQK